MKVKEIYIKDFRQFKDFKLDLTYPKGHAKEGLPLDKVCFIGQSGTGKTSLLKFIYLSQVPHEADEKINTLEIENNIFLKVLNTDNQKATLSFKKTNFTSGEPELKRIINTGSISYESLQNEKSIALGSLESIRAKTLDKTDLSPENLIYFPSSLRFEIKKTNEKSNHINKQLFDFSKINIYSVWELLIVDITKHQETELKIRQDISIAAETGDLKKIQKEVKKLEEWKKNTFNPIKDVADNCINQLIKHYSLRVKEDLDFQQKDDIGFIKIEDFDGNEVPHYAWSTGTKQVILSALPLYLLKPKNSIILFDEPETSLYPDLQRVIIDYYQSFTKDSQFFYATHSPIIASSFEPWVIVELKFNEEGHVYRELYYEEENHVDNYYIDPRFLNFDLMLKKVFDMDQTNGDKRYEALGEYGMLKNQLDRLKKENKLQTPEAKDIYKKFKSLSKKLAVNPEQYAAT